MTPEQIVKNLRTVGAREAADLIDALRRQVADLTAERDAAWKGRADSDQWADQFRDERDRAEQQVADLTATLVEISGLEGIRYERAVSFALAALARVESETT